MTLSLLPVRLTLFAALLKRPSRSSASLLSEFYIVPYKLPVIQILTTHFRWQGAEENEIGIDAESGATLVRIDPKYYRPTEVELLLGDATKAKNILGWTPSTDYDVS